MQNLAGVEAERAKQAVEAELRGADVPVVDVAEGVEVKATRGGRLEVGGYVIAFRRSWAYWVAEVERAPGDGQPLLPKALASALNDARGTGEGGHYSGRGTNLGAVVRADGFGGGLPSSALREGVACWHIDTQAGLTLFVRWLRENLGRSDTLPMRGGEFGSVLEALRSLYMLGTKKEAATATAQQDAAEQALDRIARGLLAEQRARDHWQKQAALTVEQVAAEVSREVPVIRVKGAPVDEDAVLPCCGHTRSQHGFSLYPNACSCCACVAR